MPGDAAAQQRMLLGTLTQLDADEAQRLERLLRNGYGQKRKRVDENQLFLCAAQIATTGRSRRRK